MDLLLKIGNHLMIALLEVLKANKQNEKIQKEKVGMIYIIFGASGSGKTTILEVLKRDFLNVSIHVKGTTREQRQYDNGEIISVPSTLLNKYDYIYGQYGNEYGIEKLQLEEATKGGENHFVICNDIEVMKRIMDDFPSNVKTIYLHYSVPLEIFKSIQVEKNISDDEINLRLSKIKSLAQTFIENTHLFDAVLNNTYGKTTGKSLKNQLTQILEEDVIQPELAASFLALKEEIRKSMVMKGAVFQPNLLFIIMAMIKNNDTVSNIFYAIKTVSEKKGFTAERVDDVFGYDTINTKLLKHIELSEVIIADLTFERPNCYYELGYAHAKNKNVIITAKEGTKIHFDVSNYTVIFYNNMRELDEGIAKALDNHKRLRERS